MEPRENMGSGVTMIVANTPSNYQVASRSEAPSQMTGAITPASGGMPGIMEKKKRGRPRKYGPDGNPTRAFSSKSVSSSAPPAIGGYPVAKRGRGKSAALLAKQQPGFDMISMVEGIGRTDGANFTPHVITVNAGEDVTARIISFCQHGPRAICILSATGMVSNATLLQSESSGGTLTYEGRFEIVNLCGSFTPDEKEGTVYRPGMLSVSLSSPNGQVVGGGVAGLLIAASPVQIIVGSFLPSYPPEVKPKKVKVRPTSPAPFTITSAPLVTPPPSSVLDREACNGPGHSERVPAMQNFTSSASYRRDNWANTHAMQERRIATTDINISLPGGLQ